MAFESGTLMVLMLILSTTDVSCYVSSECSTPTHHFSCHYYYNQLEQAVTNDKNELYWLHKTFYPEKLHPPETVKMTFRITVGHIPLQNCTRNDQHPAFYFDGSQWVREWYFTLSTSTLLVFINEDVLLTFDNTITWAIHTMATGLGATVSKDNSLGMHIPKLTCMPSMEIMTETLIMLSSRLKGYARFQGIPLVWNEENRMHTSTAYVKHKDFSYEVVYQESRIGTILLLAGFVLIDIMATLLLVLLSLRYYPKPWDLLKLFCGVQQTPQKESYVYSLYWATVYVFFSMTVVFGGLMIIAHMFKKPDLQKCYKGELPCTDHFVRDVSLTKCIVTFVLVLVLGVTSILATKNCKDDGSNFVGIVYYSVQRSVFWWYFSVKYLDTKYFAGGKSNTNIKQKVYWLLFWWYFAVKYLDSKYFAGSKSSTICTCITPAKSSWIFQSLALWIVLIFLQMLALASLPTFLLLLLYPEQVFSAVLFIFSGVFCLIVSIAHVLLLDRNHSQHKKDQFWKSYRLQVLIQAFAILLLIALIGVVVGFYILLLSHGLRATGIFGFIIVNLPSVLLSGCGYIIKKHLDSTTSKNLEPHQKAH